MTPHIACVDPASCLGLGGGTQWCGIRCLDSWVSELRIIGSSVPAGVKGGAARAVKLDVVSSGWSAGGVDLDWVEDAPEAYLIVTAPLGGGDG